MNLEAGREHFRNSVFRRCLSHASRNSNSQSQIFEFAFVIVLILLIIVTVVVYLEWLKVKNNHLVIRTNQIEITNRFSKKVIYNIDYNNLKIKLEYSYKRGGGIFLSFYDSNFNYITRYEDMLNYPTPYGEKRNCWEETIKTLGLEIIDNSEIIKN